MVQPDSTRVWTRDRHRDLRWYCPPSHTSIDEFNDETLAGTRVDISGGSGRVVWTEQGDVLSAYNAGGDAGSEVHARMYPLSSYGGSLAVGDAIVTAFTLDVSPNLSFGMAGIVLADGTTYGSGNQVIARSHVATPSSFTDVGRMYNIGLSFTGYNTQVAAAAEVQTYAARTQYIRLALVAANTWRMDVSPDGVSWRYESSGGTVSKTMTPTHVGVMSTSWGTSTKASVGYEFLRRMSGVS